MVTRDDITRLLSDWGHGDRSAAERVIPLIYDELHQSALGLFRRESPGHTLQPTAIVHEAFLRLSQQGIGEVKDRAHFYTLAARVMRHLLVDHARARDAEKRGGGRTLISLETDQASTGTGYDLLELCDAIDKLRGLNERKARLVELRCFGGLSIEDAGEILELSRSTLFEEWRFARAWLARELNDRDP